MTIIVSDTSPVRALAHLGLLPVLETLFGEVLVPDSVAQELLDPPSSFARIDVADFGFLKVSRATNRQRVAELREQLDFGEAEAIALAQEVRAEALLIDERAGRNAARQLGLSPLGTVGLLLRAKERGLCGDIAPLLDQLRSELRFFISGSFYVHALRLAGELPPLAQWANSIWNDCDGNFRDAEGRDVGLRIDDPDRGPAWVTAARLYRMGVMDGQPLSPTEPTPIPLNGKPVPGTFDEAITFRCRRCAQRAPLPLRVLDTIKSIHRNAKPAPSSSPVLELPDEAWDGEPGLNFPCPTCQQPHRSTPFAIDRRPL